MEKVRVEAANGSYDIEIGEGILSSWTPPEQYAVVTDTHVHALYGSTFPEDRYAAVLPAGESTKSISRLEKILERMAAMDLDRSATLIAFGGGVIGDVGGLAAALYKRGINYIQVPTTLLSQVDSSVGGKVGINLNSGKNLAGTFYQPTLVISDTSLLESLPPREYQSGMAEVIKYAYIASKDLFDALFKEDKPTDWIVKTCCEIKAKYVKEDPYDRGVRMQLNYGHTIGHALEAGAGYGRYSHGEAVAIGMVCAARIGETLGVSPEGLEAGTKQLLEMYELPTKAPREVLENALQYLNRDKKIFDGKLRMVLIDQIGHAVMQEITPAKIEEIVLSPQEESAPEADDAQADNPPVGTEPPVQA